MLQGFLEVEVMKINVGIERIDDRLVGIDRIDYRLGYQSR